VPLNSKKGEFLGVKNAVMGLWQGIIIENLDEVEKQL